MLDAANSRGAVFPIVQFQNGLADVLPLPEGEIERTVIVQVLEYLRDIPSATNEAGYVFCTYVPQANRWNSVIWHL